MPEQKKPKEAQYYDHPLNIRLGTLVNKKNIAEFSKALGVTQDAVRQWQAGYTMPKVDRLGEIADFFGVSLDFLLGKTETPSPNIEMQAIANYTGLSEQAINILHTLPKEQLDIISQMIASRTLFLQAVDDLDTMRIADKSRMDDKQKDAFIGECVTVTGNLETGETITSPKTTVVEVTLSGREAGNYYAQQARLLLSQVVEEIRHVET